MKTLITFACHRDPYTMGTIDGTEHPGPILALLLAMRMERVILVEIPEMTRSIRKTRLAIEKSYPDIQVEIEYLPISNTTNLAQVLHNMQILARKIDNGDSNDEYFICVASGSPQMQVGWLALVGEGHLSAELLCIHPGQHLTREVPIIFSINSTSKSFKTSRMGFRSAFLAEPGEPFLEDVMREIGCIGEHPRFRKALDIAATLARHSSPILLQGATGTGKDVLARLIHRMSERADKPFIMVNCASIPETLAESILFGHRKGAFTGAIMRQKGKFELADGGTLLLDELGELSLKVQAKLLRVIEDGATDPLGSARPLKVNVRIIASTNRDLQQQVAQGHFREDLFYRLRVGEIWLPSLGERRSDIPKIALHILERINASLKTPRRLSTNSLEYLQQRNWPGNIRDLQNVIERAAMLTQKSVLEPEDLQQDGRVAVQYQQSDRESPVLKEGFSMETYLGSLRKRLILDALEQANGNQSEAARLLKISPQAVHQFLKSQNE